MKKVKKAFLSCALLVLFGYAYAASGTNSGKITNLRWYEGHSGLLVKQEEMSDLGGCGRADYYILSDQHPYFDQVYALILSAHIAEQPLSIAVDGCLQGISKIKHISSNK
ncbi:hypothetical protein QSV34_07665 [Porticoccus sp. W117]|uniref:hypothetical protein n=1 Tax=Porticoccus sp. W117 TaxID=3054777 RepID=UPI002597D7DD|nr:hypothetical protein [Porticoccus sp. W117]MDM3871231.1 hypothetical protein [Porticoccus sp. W117]